MPGQKRDGGNPTAAACSSTNYFGGPGRALGHVCVLCVCVSIADTKTHIFMATLCNRAGHYIFALWFLSIYLLFFLA